MSRGVMAGAAVAVVAVIVLVIVVVLVIDGNGDNDQNGDVDTNGNDAVAVGESVYNRDCFGCHSIDGSSSVGPTLQGLYGSEQEYDDGTVLVVDEDHLREAIVDPRAMTRAEYPDVMPPFGNLDDYEIDGLIAFIRSLE
jgi:cytochrome c2